MKKFTDAHNTCTLFLNSIEESSKDCFKVLMKLVQNEIDTSQRKTKDEITGQIKYDLLNIFPAEEKLCQLFPTFILPFSSINDLKMRLYFDIPIEPPNLHPVFQASLIEDLTVTMIENKPEAPWIKRNTNGVIFTDNVQVFEDLDLETEEREKTEKDRKREIDKMKAKLMLDQDIEQKLKNLSKNGKKQQNKQENPQNKGNTKQNNEKELNQQKQNNKQ